MASPLAALRSSLPPRLNVNAEPVESVRVQGSPVDMVRKAREAVLEAKRLESSWLEGHPVQTLRTAAAYRESARIWLEHAAAAKLTQTPPEAPTQAEAARKTRLLHRAFPYEEGSLLQPADYSRPALERAISGAEAAAALPEEKNTRRLAAYVLQTIESPPEEAVRREGPQRLMDYSLRRDTWGPVATEIEQFLHHAQERAAKGEGELLSPQELKGMNRIRGLAEYSENLPGFLDHVQSLGPDQTWVDVGGGAFKAARDYFEGVHGLPGAGKVVGFDLAATPGATALEAEHPGRFQFHEGNVTASSLTPRASVLTDFYGALSYERDPSRATQRYADMLEKGGRLYLVHNETLRGGLMGYQVPTSSVVQPDGSFESLSQWLSQIPGFALQAEGSILGGRRYLVLEKVADAVKVPPLDLIGYQWGTPPRRVLTPSGA